MEDYRKIRIGTVQVGIVGLQGVLAELAGQAQTLAAEKVGPLIREKLAIGNYFAPGSEPLYEEAFLREYQKHCGLPVTDNSSAVLTIKVIGPGCPRCERLRDDVLQALSAADLPADFEYVSDPQEVAVYGLIALPALMINGRLKSAGRVPGRSDLQNWLTGKDGQGEL